MDQLNININLPWITIGDFNTVMKASEKSGGITIPFKKLEFLSNFIFKAGLIESTIKGNKFTRKSGEFRNIHCKLDRILVNHDFINQFPNFRCYSLPQATSDHNLFTLFFLRSTIKHNFPFRFING